MLQLRFQAKCFFRHRLIVYTRIVYLYLVVYATCMYVFYIFCAFWMLQLLNYTISSSTIWCTSGMCVLKASSQSFPIVYLTVFLAQLKAISSCLISHGHREQIVPFLFAAFVNLKTAGTSLSLTIKYFLSLGKQSHVTQLATCCWRICFLGHLRLSPRCVHSNAYRSLM